MDASLRATTMALALALALCGAAAEAVGEARAALREAQLALDRACREHYRPPNADERSGAVPGLYEVNCTAYAYLAKPPDRVLVPLADAVQRAEGRLAVAEARRDGDHGMASVLEADAALDAAHSEFRTAVMDAIDGPCAEHAAPGRLAGAVIEACRASAAIDPAARAALARRDRADAAVSAAARRLDERMAAARGD